MTTTLCPSCKKLTRPDDVHTCFDFDAVQRLRDAEAAVVAAAEALEFAFRDPADPWGYTVDEKQDALLAAVRALREVRGCR